MILLFRSGYFFTFFFVLILLNIRAEPPREIPTELYEEFTLHGSVGVSHWYWDGSYSPEEPKVYTREMIEGYLERIARKEQNYYLTTDTWLYLALEKYIDCIEGKSVAIMGSVVPWYESIVIHYGGHPTIIEYNKIISEDERIKVMTVEEYKKNPIVFDVIISISSFEHDGLGRYGDPIDPYGDLKAMENAKKMLKDDGVMFLAVPIGEDHLWWNAHRIYGRIRFPRLIRGWSVIDSFGFQEENFDVHDRGGHQPIFVLTKQ